MTNNTVFLGLGSNQGNKFQQLEDALGKINEQIGEIIHISSVYESAPWGFESENTFYNIVIACQTKLAPFDLLEKTENIERATGRIKSTEGVYHDRKIDIDILYYNDLILDTKELKIPHPAIWDRDFVYVPLLEIAPDYFTKTTALNTKNHTLKRLEYLSFSLEKITKKS